MSKIGNKIIIVPASVQITTNKQEVVVKGQHGTLSFTLPFALKANLEGVEYTVSRNGETKQQKSLHGLYRSLIANAVAGVTTPWTRRLEIVGTGFTVKLQGTDLHLKIGYNHPVIFVKQEGVAYSVEGTTKIVVTGIDKQLVGQVAHQIKMLRKPDVYKGKGVRYEGERLQLKPGKKAKAAGAAA